MDVHVTKTVPKDTVRLSRNETSRMTGDCHVRFGERLAGETPACLLGVPRSPEYESQKHKISTTSTTTKFDPKVVL